MSFKNFANKVRKQFYSMAEEGPLFIVDINKDELFQSYQEAFPPGTNKIFRERQKYDCDNCNKFIFRIGRVVKIVNNELITVWNIDHLEGPLDIKYQIVAKKMDTLIKKCKIDQIFLIDPEDAYISVESNIEDLTVLRSGHDHSKDPPNIDHITWHHFNCIVPDRFLSSNKGTLIGDASSAQGVFERGLEEINIVAIELVLDLIDSNSIYRGEEFRSMIEEFRSHKEIYSNLKNEKKEYYTWLNYKSWAAKIRGTAIGTLLLDLSNGIELNNAVNSYEKKVAPENYKRTSAPITKHMIEKAILKIDELGLRDSLERRYAQLEDVSINNVIFADRSASELMQDNLVKILSNEVKENPKQFDGIEEVSIEEFISKIVPKCNSIKIQFTNNHENNLVSLIAPVHIDAPLLFKWNNNFSWTYNGNITDSLMKRRVKSAGGNIDAYLRFSIQWNEDGDNHNDFDAHVFEPNSNHIYYPNKGLKHPSSGHLDVDIVEPIKNVAVENITYTNPAKMPEGKYRFFVHNYTHRGGRSGFRAEIEFDGIIYKFSFDKNLADGHEVTVANILYSRENGLKIIESLPHDKTSKEIWGIKTEKFHKVNAIMYSPNHWNNIGVGNRHYFFMIDGCKNEDKARGFYNEFIKNELNIHRKVFEVLGEKMKCEKNTNQISGLGFSSTKRNSVIVKISEDINRTLKIIF